MGLVAQKFEDISLVFFGTAWKEPMAEVLDVEVADIDAWLADPATLPANIETRLQVIGAGRVEEIQAFLYLVKEAGVSRDMPRRD